MLTNLKTLKYERLQALIELYGQLLSKRKVILIFGTSFLISFLEFFGIAIIFPFIKLVTDNNFKQNVSKFFAEYNLIITNDQSLVMYIGVFMVCIIIMKGFLYTKLISFQASISADINRFASDHLISTALNSRYQLFQEIGAVKIAAISYTNTTHSSLLLQSVMAANNEIILLGLILFSMLAYSFSVGIGILALLAILFLVLFRPISKKVANIGRQNQEVDLARHRFIFAMASAIRDIKIMGLESVFSKRNRAAIDAHVNLHATYIVISAMQRIAVETIMVCSIIFAGIWLSFSQVDLLSLAPLLATLGLFAARATPSISRLAANYNNIMHSLPYVETLIDMRKTILEYPQPLLEKKIKFNGDYAIKNISFGYDNETNILENVSLELLYGKVIIIVGESGSGKSTLLDLIVGLHPISKGEFELNGQPFIPFQCRSFSNEIGYVPQSIALFDATFSYNITLEDQPNLERLEYAIEAANLKPLISALPSGLETILGEAGQGVSGGQRQRIGIARALYRKPSFLVLDEITSALDASTGASVMKKLLSLRGKVTILLVTHDMSMIEHADLVYQIKDKKISQLTDVEKSTR